VKYAFTAFFMLFSLNIIIIIIFCLLHLCGKEQSYGNLVAAIQIPQYPNSHESTINIDSLSLVSEKKFKLANSHENSLMSNLNSHRSEMRVISFLKFFILF
jgi:hypothetical protein